MGLEQWGAVALEWLILGVGVLWDWRHSRYIARRSRDALRRAQADTERIARYRGPQW